MAKENKPPDKKNVFSASVKIHFFADMAIMIITDIVIGQKFELLGMRYQKVKLIGEGLTLLPFGIIMAIFGIINHLFNKNRESGDMQLHILLGIYLVYITALLLVSIFWDGSAPAAAELYFYF